MRTFVDRRRFLPTRKLACAFAALVLPLIARAQSDNVVSFNEIHYHPTASQSGGEWIELKNRYAVNIDMSRWKLSGGVDFTFPQGTVLPAGGYLLIAANPAALQTSAGVTGVLGPFTGQLSNSGERLALLNNSNRVMDEITYGTDGDWPTAADGGGATLARRGDNYPSDKAASWRASENAGGTPKAANFSTVANSFSSTLVTANGAWKYRADGQDLGTDWKAPAASEAGWSDGNGSFRLGSGSLPAPATFGTALPGGPVTYYFRRSFDFVGQISATEVKLRLLVDDGAAVYLNGTEIARANLPAAATAADAAINPLRGNVTWQEFSVPATLLLPTGNVLAAEVHQARSLPAYAAAVVASGPLAYWRMGDASAATGGTLDLANLDGVPEQGAQNGTLQNLLAANLAMAGPRPSDVVASQPLLGFEGGNLAPAFQGGGDGGNDVAIFPDAGLFNFSTGKQFTVEAWVKGAATQEGSAAIIAKGNGGAEQFALDFVSNKLRFFVRDASGTAWAYQTAVTMTSTWQHVAAVFDAPAGRMRLYINGVDAGGLTPPPTSLLSTGVEVSVGSRRSGSSSYDANFNGSVDEVAVFSRALTAAEVLTHFQAGFVASASTTDTTDAIFSAELTAVETLPPGQSRGFVLNEVSTSGVELMNLGGASSTAGLTMVRVTAGGNVSTPLALGDVAPGNFAQLPLTLADGDRVVLYAADGTTILDSTAVKKSPRSRFPNGTGPWFRPVALTPGGANSVALNSSVAINELMFDPPTNTYFPAGTARAGKWIELKNRTASPVDLTGWAFTEGVDYKFPAGTLLPANGYLVVAENPTAVMSIHGLAANQVLGPWSGSLSGSGETLRLEDPSENPADEVRYSGGGRWPEASDGGGSSLELRDANADHRVPEAWAASDESSKAGWQTFTWSGPNVSSQPNEPTLWKEFNLMLLDGPGELLIDDVRLTDTTTGTNLIQNGDFSAGAAHWRFLGTHRTSRVEGEPGNPTNQVLHLVADGPGEHFGNKIESTYVGNQALTENRVYEISLRARWLSGGARLNTKLYYNRLPKTNVLAIPPNGGTPGAANSRVTGNLGPTFANLIHSPVVPNVGQAVTVSVDVAAPLGANLVQLRYAVAGGAWQTTNMVADGTRYSGTIPGQTAGKSVQFYVTARDNGNVTTTFPARGVNSRALFVVQDGKATGTLQTFRLLMTTADAVYMHTDVNVASNEPLGATVIADEKTVYYDMGVRLKGSLVGRYVDRVGFNLSFGPDQLYRGTYDKVAVDRSNFISIGAGDTIYNHMLTAAGAVPGMYYDVARFIHPLTAATNPLGVDMTVNACLRLAGFDEIFLDSQFPSGSDGQMYEIEVFRRFLSSPNNDPEALKGPGNGGSNTNYTDVELADYGTNKDAYRCNAYTAMARKEDNYAGLIDFYRLFSLSGTAFVNRANQVLDVDEWLRALACDSLLGVADGPFIGGSVHNFRVYFRPNDGKAMLMPWDWDSALGPYYPAAGDTNANPLDPIGHGNMAKIVTASPDLTRRYYAQLSDLIGTTFNTGYMSTWVNHYASVSGQDYSSILTYIGARANAVTAKLPSATTTFTAAAGTVAPTGSVTLSGAANIKVTAIEVNGILYTPVWSSNTNWSIVVPLVTGSNQLAVKGYSLQGVVVPSTNVNLTVNNPYVAGWAGLKINEWLAENKGLFVDPADGESDDWFELYNPTASAVSVAGWKLTDTIGTTTPYVIPTGWSIPAGGYLLVWADNQTAQTPATQTAGAALHANFKLSADGDTIQLSAPDGREIDLVTFGHQTGDLSEGRDPANPTRSVPLTIPTPGAKNVFTVVTAPVIGPNGPEVHLTTTPGVRYQLEWSDALATWTAIGTEQIATGTELILTDPAPDPTKRFYRVRVKQ
jgi:hypothetical protein